MSELAMWIDDDINNKLTSRKNTTRIEEDLNYLQDYLKVIDTLNSCETVLQTIVANKMIHLFCNKWDVGYKVRQEFRIMKRDKRMSLPIRQQ